MNKLVEIFTAWGIALDPDQPQQEQAARRLAVCEGCEHKSDIPFKRCTLCGCALKAKVFSPVKNACPAGRWKGVDMHLPDVEESAS